MESEIYAFLRMVLAICDLYFVDAVELFLKLNESHPCSCLEFQTHFQAVLPGQSAFNIMQAMTSGLEAGL